MPHIIPRRRQPFQRPLRFGLIPCHADHDPSRARILRHQHRTDASQPDSRIAQLALKNRLNLFADRPAQPFAMIFLATMLHRPPRRRKLVRISERGQGQLPKCRGTSRSEGLGFATRRDRGKLYPVGTRRDSHADIAASLLCAWNGCPHLFGGGHRRCRCCAQRKASVLGRDYSRTHPRFHPCCHLHASRPVERLNRQRPALTETRQKNP